MKPKIIVLWHEGSDCLATTEIRKDGGLPLLAICDDVTMINPFYSYPLNMLKWYGWIEIGRI